MSKPFPLLVLVIFFLPFVLFFSLIGKRKEPTLSDIMEKLNEVKQACEVKP